MTGFFIMLKSNIKLILRNKASIFLIFLVPLASTLLLMIPIKRDNMLSDLPKLNIVVFDSSSDSLSEEIINELKNNSSYRVTVQYNTAKDVNSAGKEAVNSANRSVNTGFVYIPPKFYDSVMHGNTEDLITVFTTGTDNRIKLLNADINMMMSRFCTYAKVSGGSSQTFQELMKKAASDKTSGKSVTVSSGDKVLKSAQQSKLSNFNYFVAIMTFTLMFSGNFISAIFIQEKNNKVLKRITITKSSLFNYGMVKFLIALIILIVQVCMIAIGIKLFVNTDTGMNLKQIALLIFCLGLMFNTLSIALGASFQSLSTANYLAFFITVISALMAGLYFPLDYTPKWMQNFSLLMPQRWVSKTAEQMILGNSSCVILFGLIVTAYVILFLSIGFLGLKLNND